MTTFFSKLHFYWKLLNSTAFMEEKAYRKRLSFDCGIPKDQPKRGMSHIHVDSGQQQQSIQHIDTTFRFRLQGVDFSYIHSTAYCSSHKYLYNKNVLCIMFCSYIIFSKSTLFSYDYAEYYFCFRQKWCENSIFLYIGS